MAAIPNINPQYQTLNKFGVPQIGIETGLGIMMPKLKHRFRVVVYGFGEASTASLLNITRQVITAGRPSINYNETALHSYNNIAYIAQKPEWAEIEVVVRDDIGNLVSGTISDQLQRQMNHYTQSAAPSHANYKFNMELQILDGTMSASNIIESWYLEGCYLKQVAYDSTDYSSSDPVTITMTIRYDNATQGNEQYGPEINSIGSTIETLNSYSRAIF